MDPLAAVDVATAALEELGVASDEGGLDVDAAPDVFAEDATAADDDVTEPLDVEDDAVEDSVVEQPTSEASRRGSAKWWYACMVHQRRV